MKDYIRKQIWVIFLLVGLLIGAAGLAWAMTPIPVCFFSAANVCSNVTTSNPLPTAYQ